MINALNYRPNVSELTRPPIGRAPRTHSSSSTDDRFEHFPDTLNMRVRIHFALSREMVRVVDCSAIIINQALRLSIRLTQPHFKTTKELLSVSLFRRYSSNITH